jgi:hypothetical protein
MKQHVILLVIAATFILTSFLTIRQYISGKIYSNNPTINGHLVGSYIYVKSDNKIIAGDYVDKARHYHVDFLANLSGKGSFDFYLAGKGIDTTFLKSFTTFESEVVTWDIQYPGEIKK